MALCVGVKKVVAFALSNPSIPKQIVYSCMFFFFQICTSIHCNLPIKTLSVELKLSVGVMIISFFSSLFSSRFSILVFSLLSPVNIIAIC